MLSIGLIGYGYWGPNLARCIQDHPECRLASIADPDHAARARAFTRHPGARVQCNPADLLKESDVDAVVIATPVDSHRQLADQALGNGKHVLVEKPLATSAGQAAELAAEADHRQLTLMVDHTFVYTPAITKIKELIDSGEIGRTQYYDSTRVNLGIFQRDVNVIWDLAVHDFSILSYIFPEQPCSISAHAVSLLPGRPESMATLNLRFPSGAIAHINVNWMAPVKVRQTLIGGTRKMILYDDIEPSEKVKVYDRGAHVIADDHQRHQIRVAYRTGDMWAPQIKAIEPLKIMFDHFVTCVVDGVRPRTDGLVGLEVVAWLEAAMVSLTQDGRHVALEAERLAS